MLYDNQLHQTVLDKPNKVVVYKDDFYGLLKDYNRTDKGEHFNNWSWDTWYLSYGEHFFTKEFSNWKDFDFSNKKIKGCHNDNVPEPSVVGLLLVASMVLIAWKRRLING